MDNSISRRLEDFGDFGEVSLSSGGSPIALGGSGIVCNNGAAFLGVVDLFQ